MQCIDRPGRVQGALGWWKVRVKYIFVVVGCTLILLVYVYIYVFIYICMSCIYMCIYICICIYNVYMHICIYNVCMYVYIYSIDRYINIYIYTYIYMYEGGQRSSKGGWRPGGQSLLGTKPLAPRPKQEKAQPQKTKQHSTCRGPVRVGSPQAWHEAGWMTSQQKLGLYTT